MESQKNEMPISEVVTTPLLTACIEGRYDDIVRLLDEEHVDIEGVGSVISNGSTTENASPLWCAASVGHLDIVQLLVTRGALVNSTTKTNCTPLRAACCEGHLHIVLYLIDKGADVEIADELGQTCLMIACYRGHYHIALHLLSHRADVNKKNSRGHTALYACAETGKLQILQLLARFGVELQAGTLGITAPPGATVMNQPPIVDYILNECKFSKLEKVNFLEILGAVFVANRNDMISGFGCWRKAMQLRYEDSEFLLEKQSEECMLERIVHKNEVRTLEQLEEINLNPVEMQIQALLVRDRILGTANPENTHYLCSQFLQYLENIELEKCFLLFVYIVYAYQLSEEPLFIEIYMVFVFFNKLIHYIVLCFPAVEDTSYCLFQLTVRVFQIFVTEIERATNFLEKNETNSIFLGRLRKILNISLDLLVAMCVFSPNRDEENEKVLKECVYRLVHLNPKVENNWTLLHLACSNEAELCAEISFPLENIIDLLLEVGASPNAVDFNKNTPLHIAAMNIRRPQNVFKSLLNKGAHLDFCNSEKKTPLDLLQDPTVLNREHLNYITLQCLCAKAIKKQKISYEDLHPAALKKFVDSH